MLDTRLPAERARDLRQAAHAWRQRHPDHPTEQAAAALGTTEGLLIAASAGIHPGEPADWRVVRLQPLGPEGLSELLALGAGQLRWCAGDLTARAEAHWLPGPAPNSWVEPRLGLHWRGAADPTLQHFACRQRFGRDHAWRLVAVDPQGQLRWQWRLGEDADLEGFGRLLARRASPRLDAGLDPLPRPPVTGPAPAPAPAPVREAWLRTRCADEAAGLQQRWGLDRWALLGLADPRYAQPLDPATLPELLDRAAEEGLVLQADMPQGPQVLRWPGAVRPAGPGTGLAGGRLGPVHWPAPAPAVAAAWLVRQPTRQGSPLRLELFDAGRRLLLRLGPHGSPCGWEGLLASLADAPSPPRAH